MSRPKNRCYETMLRVTVGFYVVRVWQPTRNFDMIPDNAVVLALDGIARSGPYEIAKVLDGFGECIAAYEILDQRSGAHYGCGGICYPDWK